MITLACQIAIGVIGLSLLFNVYRLVAGPDVLDRILALDTMTVNAIALIVVVAMFFEAPVYFEAALLFAMVGFLTTVSFCKYLLRGNVIE
ncbi:K+/H+ antiporter subunit F [Chelatococcus composti]|jgi:multicomponent K+:H+ antiporter subunit F|uniref:Multicomponent K+:H+ antiporter subunit F n=1 Tax=Chelatococcus composti TaxID=1743235 RepID=A0A841K3U0_9HYPH|nr:K+/H+ antiporter subunit F [Chelatococcus composti]MBB6167438.1 multicomponent K+:H+ antiporter subunit F [Chelatococcus composti]MBS7735643.1 K+/H+ antiporter subunit F [Chelatococcus composti]PZN43434.1 MAG: K+/H+ antiporter subunit F [Pseudomonadota bacterium]GGG31927.1 K+/H+ antiporter subunit F [Chelatococcus composti]